MTDTTVERFDAIAIQLNRIVPILQIICGTFGNVMNIVIFTRRSLRNNPCSTYFLALSINNLLVLYIGLLTRLLSSGWNIDPSQSNDALCKLRIFFVYVTICLTQWFIVLASIDRFLSSCSTVRYRQLSNLSLSRKLTIGLIIFITLAHFHTLIWWSSSYVNSIQICDIYDATYDTVFSFFYLLFSCLLPPCLMIIFGLKTISNVRKMRTQINTQRTERLRSKDRQMITMLLCQVFLTILCTTPFTAIILYNTINTSIAANSLSPSAVIVYNFSGNICRLLNYFNPVLGFYVYTLSGERFRAEIKCLFGKILIRFGCSRYLSEDFRRSMST